MRIGIDIDGCVVNQTKTLINALRPGAIVPFVYTSFANKAWIRYHVEPILYKDAADVIRRLKADGNDIFFITARTAKQIPATEKMLSENDIPYDSIYCGAKDKASLAKTMKIDVMIDDKPKNVKSSRRAGIKTIKFKHKYNCITKSDWTCDNWEDIYGLFQR